jgi:hypothetical protein
MSTCKEMVYEFPDPEEDLCYYHAKVRDGLIVSINDDIFVVGGIV